MFFREKTHAPAQQNISWLGSFSALRRAWSQFFSPASVQSAKNQPSMQQDFSKQDCTPDLHGLVDTLQKIRRRILANKFLGGWAAFWSWILFGLILVFAVSTKLAVAILLTAGLAAAGAAVILIWTWRTRLSTYQTACRLDSVADLQDRVSTAIYLGDTKNPDGMIERQRGDTLSRIAKIDLHGLFPLQLPFAARRALVLLLIVGALFFYRLHHKPPLVSLLQTAARSSLVQSILSPMLNAMEKDLQRAVSLVTTKNDNLADIRAGESPASSEDLWQSNNEKGTDAKEAQDNSLDAGAGDVPEDQMQPPGDQNSSPSTESKQQSSSSTSQEGKNGEENSSGEQQKSSNSQGPQNSKESLSQSLMQALKNMMSKSPNQQSKNRDNRGPDSEGAPQSGDSHQPGNNDSDKKGDSRGNSDAKQNPTQSASNGAGSQQGIKELKAEQTKHAFQAVPDRVALESSGFKEQTRMRVDTDTGTAQLAMRDQTSQTQAVINGAEQENIPPRYRLYVQRYFEHSDAGKK